MKNAFLLTISVNCLLAFNCRSQATQAKSSGNVKLLCSYRLSYRPDTAAATILTEKMLLLVAGDFSEFRSANRFARDSLKNALITRYDAGGADKEGLGSEISALLRIPVSRFTYLIYKNFSRQECLVYDDILQEHYRYSEPDFPLHWTITPTQATVGGYACQKATTFFAGRPYEAWFTREIPVSDGPYKFSGLPGLIVKIKDNDNNYMFELTAVRAPLQPTTISIPAELTMTTTKKTFFQAARAARESLAGGAAQHGITFKEPEAVRARMQEKLKHNNNPLELAP